MPQKRRLSGRKKRQRRYYSGKKKRHTLKTQVVVDKQSRRIVCAALSNGKRHDFRLFKESQTHIHPKTIVITDTGYQGLQKRHAQTQLPKKKNKKHPLTKEEKKSNQKLASQRVLNENVIGLVKRFKIVADRYINKRKRFGLRFNLISGIVNFEST